MDRDIQEYFTRRKPYNPRWWEIGCIKHLSFLRDRNTSNNTIFTCLYHINNLLLNKKWI